MRKALTGLIALVVVAGGLWLGFDRSAPGVIQPSFVPPATELPTPLPPLAAGQKVAFLELGSEGCKPCEAMKPVLQAVRDRFPDQVKAALRGEEVWDLGGALPVGA